MQLFMNCKSACNFTYLAGIEPCYSSASSRTWQESNLRPCYSSASSRTWQESNPAIQVHLHVPGRNRTLLFKCIFTYLAGIEPCYSSASSRTWQESNPAIQVHLHVPGRNRTLLFKCIFTYLAGIEPCYSSASSRTWQESNLRPCYSSASSRTWQESNPAIQVHRSKILVPGPQVRFLSETKICIFRSCSWLGGINVFKFPRDNFHLHIIHSSEMPTKNLYVQ